MEKFHLHKAYNSINKIIHKQKAVECIFWLLFFILC